MEKGKSSSAKNRQVSSLEKNEWRLGEEFKKIETAQIQKLQNDLADRDKQLASIKQQLSEKEKQIG